MKLELNESKMRRLVEEIVEDVGSAGLMFEVDWRKYTAGMKVYAKEVSDKWGGSLSVQKYLEWGATKEAGMIPTGMAASVADIGKYMQGRMADSATFEAQVKQFAPLAHALFTDPTVSDIKGKITAEMIGELNKLKTRPGSEWAAFIGQASAGVAAASINMQMFEEINTKMAPATRVTTMKWS